MTHGKAGLVRLGLPIIAALTPPDWDVRIHDTRIDPVPFDEHFDLVGITAFTAEIPSAYAISDEFRRRGVPVVIGGVHASALPEEALEHADAVAVGEAEHVWEQILSDLTSGTLGRIYHSDTLCDMKNMVIPRRDLLKREVYVTGFNTLQATRGCPFDCDYCAVTGVFGREFRMRPVSEVIDEIRAFDKTDFFLVDDNICGNPGYAKELFRALKPLKRAWGSQTSITFARDEELLRLYAESGGKYAFIGFETISTESLAGINKKWNKAETYGDAIKRIHAAGINVLGSFIFGLDEDDTTVFGRTLDFIMEHRIDAAQFHILTPFPGTRLYDKMKRDGRIIETDWAKYHTAEVVFQPAKMTAEELQWGFFNIWRETYSIPNMMKRIFRSPRGLVYRIAMNVGYRNKAMRMPDVGKRFPG